MEQKPARRAEYWEPLSGQRVKCLLCPWYCRLKVGQLGVCRCRKNIDGELQATSYGEVVSLAMDPIEKKPLYHFFPGEQILSTAPNGCNFKCPYCQNADISQGTVPTRFVSPEELVSLAERHDSFGVCYTYTEPLIWFEYLIDAGSLVHQRGLKNVLVTNGMINEEPLRRLLPLIDAMNIDLKAMDEDFYRRVAKGNLKAVLKTIEISKESCHVEITNLIIPTLNDKDGQISTLVDWVADLGVDTPLHLSRYFPHYKLRLEPTPIPTMLRAFEIAKRKLRYVYLGNVSLKDGSDTLCYYCGNVLVSRDGYFTRITGIENRKCNKCGTDAEFVLS
ncbi:MAG: AmmeMemoRadiSam system radical SAM enzyme [bacterium]